MKTRVSWLCALLLLCNLISTAQTRMSNLQRLKAVHISNDFAVSHLQHPNWSRADETAVTAYWSGKTAPPGRHFKSKLLWSDTGLYIRFEAEQREPLVI